MLRSRTCETVWTRSERTSWQSCRSCAMERFFMCMG